MDPFFTQLPKGTGTATPWLIVLGLSVVAELSCLRGDVVETARSTPTVTASASAWEASSTPLVRVDASQVEKSPSPPVYPPLGDRLPGSAESTDAGQLSEDDVRAVVYRRLSALKKTCWERSRSPTPEVTEKVQIVIAGNGTVTSATANGNDPLVGDCLETQIKM